MKSLASQVKIVTHERESAPNTLFLAFNQTSLRLRHLTQIIGYNLTKLPNEASFSTNPLPSELPRPIPKNGYYFTLQSSVKGNPQYASDMHSSNSPTWPSFDCGSIFPIHLRSLKGIIVRVWLRLDQKDTSVASWGVNFSGLVPLPSKLLSFSDFAPNTLVFKLKGRYFTSYDNLKPIQPGTKSPLVELHQGLRLAEADTKPSYSVPFLSRLHSTKRDHKRLEGKRESLRQSLEAKGISHGSRRTQLHRKIEDVKIRINLLMEQLNLEMNKLRAIKLAADNQDIQNQDKGIELLEGYQALNKYLNALQTQEMKTYEENELLKGIMSKMKDRRCHLLSQLPIIFPLQKSEDDGQYKICGIGLPDAESYDGVPEQSLGIALGYVAQLLVKIAFFVNIPLKYPITLRGSLSSIADLTSTQLADVETQFPLYTRGKEKEKLHFNYGVFLLNKNVAQLRWSCGLPTSDLRPTLQNVLSFLCSLYQNSLQPRAFMPDTVVPPVILPASLRQVVQTPTSLLQHQGPRLPLGSTLSQSRNPKSMPHTPSSPKLKIPKKTSLEDEYFLGTTTSSDIESKLERQKSDEVHTDVDGTPLRVWSPCRKHFSARKYELQKFTSEPCIKGGRPTSFSLDQGLNYIKEGEMERGSLRERSSSKFNFTNIASLASGSFPNLASRTLEERGPSNSDEAPLANLNEQTTQLLQLWHQNDPSPYHSIVAGSSSSEKLEALDKKEGLSSTEKVHSPELAKSPSRLSQDTVKDHDSLVASHSQLIKDEIMNSVNAQIESVKIQTVAEPCNLDDEYPITRRFHETDVENKSSGDVSEVESFQRRLVKEMELSLSDFSLEEDAFLNDVASRTANLASQNCSFKFSFSRQSTQD